MAKKEKKVFTKEEIVEQELKNKLMRMEDELELLPIPTHLYEVGEQVQVANLKDCVIKEIFDGGKFYLVEYTEVNNNYGNVIERPNTLMYATWLQISKKDSESLFRKENDLKISFFQGSIASLWNKVYSFGVDFEPEYQRGYVWELEDKIALIDSIFNNVEIGKFAFIHLSDKEWSQRKVAYEILDGKQRLSTLCEFHEGKFEYKGYKYQELSKEDRYHIKNYPISIGEIENATEKEIMEYFIKLNSHGKIMDKEHLEKVKELIN